MYRHSSAAHAKRAAIYARVSTDDQAENGYSLDDQERKGQAQALAKGWVVVTDRYVDDGYSGTLRHRPALDRLLADVKAGIVDVVIITKMDRLARSLKLLLELWDLIESYGATVVVIEESIDTSTSVGRLIRNVLGSIAEFERDTFLSRSLNGKKSKILRDEVVRTPTSAPYGYRYVLRSRAKDGDEERSQPGRLEIIEEQRATVLRIFELVAGGMSTLKVAELLTREGVPTQKGRPHWGHATISHMIKNTTYTGQAPHGTYVVVGHREDKETGKNKQLRKRREPSDDDYTPCPAIVSPELWHAANAKLVINRTQSKRNAKHDYLLGGSLLKCGQCGHTMTGAQRTRGPHCYRCDGFAPDGSRVRHTTNGPEVEAAVWGALCALLRDHEQMVAALERLTDKASAEAQDLADEIASLERSAAVVEEKGERLLDLYLSGGLTKEKYESKAAALDDQVQRLRERALDLDGRRQKALQQMLPVEDIKAICAYYGPRLDAMPFEEKRTVLTTFVTRLVAYPDRVNIEGDLGKEPITVPLGGIANIPSSRWTPRSARAGIATTTMATGSAPTVDPSTGGARGVHGRC